MNKWYKYSDSYVNVVTREECHSSDAYILFYKRKNYVLQPLLPPLSSPFSSDDDDEDDYRHKKRKFNDNSIEDSNKRALIKRKKSS